MDEFKQFISSDPRPLKKPLLARYNKLCKMAGQHGVQANTVALNGKTKAELTRLFNDLVKEVEARLCTGKPLLCSIYAKYITSSLTNQSQLPRMQGTLVNADGLEGWLSDCFPLAVILKEFSNPCP